MAVTGLLGIVVLLCGGLVFTAAIGVVIYLLINERNK